MPSITAPHVEANPASWVLKSFLALLTHVIFNQMFSEYHAARTVIRTAVPLGITAWETQAVNH